MALQQVATHQIATHHPCILDQSDFYGWWYALSAPYHDAASTKRVHILDAVRRQSLSPMSINMNLAIISKHVEATFICEQHPFPITPLPPTYSCTLHWWCRRVKAIPWKGRKALIPALQSRRKTVRQLMGCPSAITAVAITNRFRRCPDVAVFSWRCDPWSSWSWTVLCLACLLTMAQQVADGGLTAVEGSCKLPLRGLHIGHTDSSVAFCLCKSRHLSDVLFQTASLLCPTPVFKQQSCTSIFSKFKLSCFSWLHEIH